MDDRRLRLLKSLTSVIEGVSSSDGYQHDLSGNVFRGRMYFGDDDPLPMVAILEDPTKMELVNDGRENTNGITKLHFNIQGFAERDRFNPSDNACRLLADVKRALVLERKRGSGRSQMLFGFPWVSKLQIGVGVVRPADDEVASTDFFVLPVTIEFVDDLESPFD